MCVVIRFYSGSTNAEVEMSIPANSTSEAENIMNNVQNFSSMGITNISVGNTTYDVTAFNSNGMDLQKNFLSIVFFSYFMKNRIQLIDR